MFHVHETSGPTLFIVWLFMGLGLILAVSLEETFA